MAKVLEVIDLVKEYPTLAEALVVLRGVNLRMAAGESLAIVGPSGSGKSTLLNIVGTLDQPTRGSVRLDGVDPFSLSSAEAARFRGRSVGFIFQDHHLLAQCTALENVLVPRLAMGKVGPDDTARASELLAKVGLKEREGHLPGELSGGERQRVAIARALINRPTMLLCDEPTGNLDAATAHIVGELIAQVAKESAAILIVVTHSLELASMFSNVQKMVDGKLVSKDQAR